MNEHDALYKQATVRNLGLVSEAEQQRLRGAKVAIAGMGAVGGHYLLALTRLGIGRFSIADADAFSAVNLHRQAGAYTHTLGRNKAAAMAEQARAINPGVDLSVFESFVTDANVEAFLEDADVVLDGIDFFQIDAHRLLHDAARARGIPVVMSGPIGYGASLHVFNPQGPTLDGYLGITPDMTRAQRMAAFGQGLVPSLPKAGALDRSRVDFEAETGPALISAVMLCTALATTEVLRLLLKRGTVHFAPKSAYFDPYHRTYQRGHATRGNWRDRLTRWLALRAFPSLRRLHRAEHAEHSTTGAAT